MMTLTRGNFWTTEFAVQTTHICTLRPNASGIKGLTILGEPPQVGKNTNKYKNKKNFWARPVRVGKKPQGTNKTVDFDHIKTEAPKWKRPHDGEKNKGQEQNTKNKKNLFVGVTKRVKRHTHITSMCMKRSTDVNTYIGLKLIKLLRVERT